MAGDFLARMEAARTRWLTLDDRHEVKIRRPHETRMPSSITTAADLEPVADFVVDWRGTGFTAAAILGDPAAGSDPMPFDRDVWRYMAFDSLAWLTEIGVAVADDVRAFKQAQADAAGK